MKKIALISLAVTTLLAAGTASAQSVPSTAYAGITGGVSHWNADCGGLSCDTTPSAYRVFAGYNLQPNVAVEVTYASLGTLKGDAPGLHAEIKGQSLDVSGLYKFGAANEALRPYVKGGLAYTKARASVDYAGLSGSDTRNAWGLVLGAGVTYAFNNSFALRAELNTQQLKVPGDSGNVTGLFIGGQFSF